MKRTQFWKALVGLLASALGLSAQGFQNGKCPQCGTVAPDFDAYRFPPSVRQLDESGMDMFVGRDPKTFRFRRFDNKPMVDLVRCSKCSNAFYRDVV